MIEWNAALTALLAGLLGSGHCIGMCGGIATTGGAISATGGTPATSTWHGALFNGGRLLSYALMGAFVGSVAAGAAGLAGHQSAGAVLRTLTACIILLIGLQWLFRASYLSGLERMGGSVWRSVLPLTRRVAQWPVAFSRLGLGMLWGLLPCGLVYTALALAGSTGSGQGGAITMLLFGIGTLPSMLGMTLAAPALARYLSRPWLRSLAGALVVVMALWSLWLVWQPAHH